MGLGKHLKDPDPTNNSKQGGGNVFTWEEIQRHTNKNDQWLVIDRKVYNITNWTKRHPGGIRVISHYAGEDATEAFTAFHPDPTFVRKFLKPLLVGELAASEPCHDHNKSATIVQDFCNLRDHAEKEGLFEAKPLFYCLHLGHILLLEVLALLLLWTCETNWTSTLLCCVILATSQSQAGWLQHDFGHLSVFKKSRWNHLLQKCTIGHIKGASACWWNHRHFQHHAKPNVIRKDPDINMLHLFLLGDTQPVEYGIKKLKYLPYNHQHKYFFFVGPPLLIPVFFHIQIIKTMFSHRLWEDIAWWITFQIRYFLCYVPFFGFLGSVLLLSGVRFLESRWFVWVTQMSHIPKEIEYDNHQDWLTMQLNSTCNIEQSAFNDWFSGHLNFQVEHHLFPTMPRHNFHRIAPMVRALCKKHGLSYEVKTLGQGFADVVRSLKKSGNLWLDAYLHK